jgi:hypothetical protein
VRTIDGIRLTARREVVERTRDRSFLISSLITLLILSAIIVLPRVLGSGSDTFDVGLVGAASQRLQPALAAQAASAGVEVRIQTPASARDAEAAVRDEKAGRRRGRRRPTAGEVRGRRAAEARHPDGVQRHAGP